MVKYASSTSVNWKLEPSRAQTLRMDCAVKEETSLIVQQHFKKLRLKTDLETINQRWKKLLVKLLK